MSTYQTAVTPELVGAYVASALSGGTLKPTDEVLEYRVWVHPPNPEATDGDAFFAFSTYEEALACSRKIAAERPLALIRDAAGPREVVAAAAEEYPNPRLVGTRADGTESLVYRKHKKPSYSTAPIVARFLEAALTPKPSGDELIRRAQNIVNRMAKYGDGGIPRNEIDLASWSDLDTQSVDGGKVKRTAPGRKAKARKFVICLGCTKRFLAKRANNTTCSSRCQRRAARQSATLSVSEIAA
jgi:hypothetical protein